MVIFVYFFECVNVIRCVFKVYFVEINEMSSLHFNPFHNSLSSCAPLRAESTRSVNWVSAVDDNIFRAP